MAAKTYGGTGNGIADMILGVGASFSQNNTQVLDIHYPAREAYIQDSIKISPRLTVMAGARGSLTSECRRRREIS